ncbi:TIGR03620 family F420-dependent LLM class oxidoreductase [Mycolicibacterium sp. P9-22]|uniref:TIGR03620 family F420-dependent LLM class oxidoreductase n=1 Tax=Mycolicibacterium sp. P9-22 TaxID=2024613 RepID=UPI0011EEADAE|nr:TIGR03620 family F420-dependent LLM class oxidoreductase [Mycolicibacterium sp. P9-22]KAA0115253.1 TIGR03620 family F420-dependent LLM class oxidoreductase [Mycolicibacterium sp. P9-22]
MSTPPLGRYGAYLLVPDFETRSLASRVKGLEDIGYGTLWIAGNAPGDLTIPESLLDHTESITVGTAIVNVWADDADVVAESFHRVDGRHPGRFVLGVGIGHREMSGDVYQKPFPALTKYVDRLLELDVPGDQIILAALRSKVLELSKTKTAGALPYFTTVAHTEKARSALGADRTLAVVQLVATDDDRDVNRSTARGHSTFYLGLQNYVSNLQENGFPDLKVGDEPSEELLQALVPLDGVEGSLERIGEHFDAGADHVAIMPVPSANDPFPALELFAAKLQL